MESPDFWILSRHALMGAVSTTCIWSAVSALLLSRPGQRRLAIWMAVGCVASAWYVYWGGTAGLLIFPNGTPAWPMSQLLSGYSTPCMFLMVLQMGRPDRPLPRWMEGLPLFGLFGTGFGITMLSMPEFSALVMAKSQAGETFQDPTGYATFLYVGHSFELFGFAIASLVALIHAWVTSPYPEVRRDMASLLLVVLGAISAVSISNLVPLFLGWTPLSWLGPLSVAPIAIMMLIIFRRSNDLALRLEREGRELRRYVPKTVARGVAKEGELRDGEADVTILFSDIRGFTALTERLPPVEVLNLLQRHLGEMAGVVEDHGGIVDKFIGDAVFAIFGLDGQDHAEKAVAAATTMLDRLAHFNMDWTAKGHAPLRIGIGLHAGRVVHGHVGNDSRREYAVLGDTVNTAARIESLTKELGVPLLVSETVILQLPESGSAAFTDRGPHPIRGRSSAIRLFTLS